MLVGDPPDPPGRVVGGHRGHGVDGPCLWIEHNGRPGVGGKALRLQACDLVGQGRLDRLLQIEVDVEHDVVAAHRRGRLDRPHRDAGRVDLDDLRARPTPQPELVGRLDAGLADHVVGAVAVLRQRVQLGRVDIARVAEHLCRGVAARVGPLGGEVDRNPGEQDLVLGQIDDDRLWDPDRYRHRLVGARLRIGERRRDVGDALPQQCRQTSDDHRGRLRTAEGDHREHLVTHENLSPTGHDQASSRGDRDRLLLEDESGVAVVRAVQDLQRPEAHHDGRESHHDDQTHDREAQTEAGTLLPALLFAFLLLEALQRARAHDPCPVPVTFFVRREIRRLHRAPRTWAETGRSRLVRSARVTGATRVP